MEKLYISKEALELKGWRYFKNDTYDTYVKYADVWKVTECDGLFLMMDDMYDISIMVSKDDHEFTNIEDLKIEYDLKNKSKYFNMKNICEVAGVSYWSYSKYANGTQSMSIEKMQMLLDAMELVAKRD